MHPVFDINVMAHWASWKLSGGNQMMSRLIVHADYRAISWLLADRLADIVGSAVVTFTMGATAGLTHHRSRLDRFRPKSRHRTPPSE
jgi:hypothetical protein